MDMSSQPSIETEKNIQSKSRPSQTVKLTVNLPLPEKLFLLSIDDYKGTAAKGIYGPVYYGLAGALLADLIFRCRLTLQEERLVIAENTLTGNDLLDETMRLIHNSNKVHKPSYWLNTLASKKLPKRIADQLVKYNILFMEEKQYLWVMPYTGTAKRNASVKYWLKQHLRAVVLAGEKPAPEDVILLSLIKTCTLLNLLFTREERKWALVRIEELGSEDLMNRDTMVAWLEIDMALNTAITVMANH
jgi:hypothetical protein